MKKTIEWLSRKELYLQIPEDDVVSRHRFALFRISSYTASIVCIGVVLKMDLTIENPGILPYLILILSAVLMINFFAVRTQEKLRTSYLIMLISEFALLHIVSYSCGGIRTGGTLYFGFIILYAFMLLGRKAGQYFTACVILHVVYLFFISTYTHLTSFAFFKNDINLINQDFLTNAVLSSVLIAYQGSYLQSGKNVIIQHLTKSKEELQMKNRLLEENNILLNEYTSSLEKTNKELEKFASVASHDLKAPLRAIGNLTGMIEEDAGALLPADVKSNFNLIKSRVHRMEQLLDALLKYSRTGAVKGVNERVNTFGLIKSVIAGRINEHVKIEIIGALPFLYSDKMKLTCVFDNLIDNAIKFNDKKNIHIMISARDMDNEWVFSVKDNGPGIENEYHEKVFVIFQTLNRRDEMENMGVGLPIVKKIVEEQGGNVWLSSERGEGTDFRFSIPKNRKQTRLDAISLVA